MFTDNCFVVITHRQIILSAIRLTFQRPGRVGGGKKIYWGSPLRIQLTKKDPYVRKVGLLYLVMVDASTARVHYDKCSYFAFTKHTDLSIVTTFSSTSKCSH